MNNRVCKRCVMDDSDPDISFDENEVCNHCLNFDKYRHFEWFDNQSGMGNLHLILDKIKKEGKGKEYDSILGLSGGVDSCYLTLKAKEFGLRPLVVHVDAGWNSELAIANIESVVKFCKFDLYTHVVDWEEIRNLQLSYLKAGVANQDVPQDHIFFASIHHFAAKNNIKYILNGGNFSTESIFPKNWHANAMDSTNLLEIQKTFSPVKLKKYKTISFFEYFIWYPFFKGIRSIRLLNYMPYNKSEAEDMLISLIGYKKYGRKHGESQFTKIFQNYFLPKKFGFDKRRPHLSSLILSNQITRKQALEELGKPLYDPIELEIDLNYFCKKMRISRKEFDFYLYSPNRTYREFKNWDSRYKFMKKIQQILTQLIGFKISHNLHVPKNRH
jgi:N-acetyl sugar amidotransferase